MTDYKVGDKVVFENTHAVPDFQFADGKVGVINRVRDDRGLSYPYSVDFGDGNMIPYVNPEELRRPKFSELRDYPGMNGLSV
jgi:ribosomal protein L21E